MLRLETSVPAHLKQAGHLPGVDGHLGGERTLDNGSWSPETYSQEKNSSTGTGGGELVGREEHLDVPCGIIHKKPKERL